jgi:hypothetical protein
VIPKGIFQDTDNEDFFGSSVASIGDLMEMVL